ncbi:MAG: hypothetical protein IJ464_05615, partial [Alistipes sp.]|nr:hypothetical protein [Alistipes sp.]
AEKEGQTPYHFTMTVYQDADQKNPIKETYFSTDIPVERNHLTTVIGNFLTTATEIEVRIDDNFAGEIKVETEIVDEETTFAEALAKAATQENAIIELTKDVEWATGASHGSTPFIAADAITKTLTIEGNGRNLVATGAGVGPIRMANDGKLIFRDVVFVDNTKSYAESSWEFLYLEFADNLEFYNCTFEGNIAIQNEDDKDDVVLFDNCVFLNTAYPAASTSEYSVWVSDGDVTFTNCKFSGNRGIKAHEDYGSEIASILVDNCEFNSLAKKPGVVLGTLNAETAVAVKNSTFTNCQAGDQGLYVYESDTDVTTFDFTLENNTIAFENVESTKTITLKGNEGSTYLFNNVSVESESGAAVAIEGDVTLNLTGEINLKGAKDGIAVADGGKLTIDGVVATRATNATLNVLPTDGFGIGGTMADVTIKNVKIDYICGTPVQPLFENDAKYGKDEPEGYSAIGGQTITLEGVEIVKAEGGSKAAAIGNRYHNSTNITIKNSTLGDIFGGNASAAIGSSRYSSNISATNKQSTYIRIENSTIANAVGGQFGAGIGSGYDTHCAANDTNAINDIVIIKSTITAQGGKHAAGIGTGYHAAALTGSIDAESTINASSGEKFYKDSYTKAQDIGYGVVDPAREFAGANVTFTVNGKTIVNPLYAELYRVNDGAYFDEANKTYYITNAAGLKWVASEVNATTPYTPTIFDEATVKLTNDIDLNNEEWIPIGDDRSQRTEWHGVFDGQNYTVYNVKITKKTDRNDDDKSSYGLFGNVQGTVKNLTVSNVSISGAPKFIGALVGRLNDGLIENCHVKNSSVTCNNWTIGGIIGQWNNGKISGCSIENSAIEGYAGVGAIAGLALNKGERTMENCSVKSCTINKNGSFGGIYDSMFGTILGAVYSGELTVNINGCTTENTKIDGVMSSVIFGYASEGDKVYVDGVCYTPTKVDTSDALTEALANGDSVVLENDIQTEAATTAPYGNKYAYKLDGGVLDGNGHELYMECYGDDYGIMTSGGTVKNLTIKEACRAIMIMYPTQDIILDNVNIGGDGVLYPINTGEAGSDGVNLIVTNSTLAGWVSYSNIESASFTNVEFKQGTYYNNIYGRVLKPYVNTTLTECAFMEHMNLDLSGLTLGHKVTIKSCTVNGQAVTASVFTVPSTDAQYDTELFTVDLPSWASSVTDCVVFE